ncbi:Mrr restriction endonuclease-like protein [Kordia periserrulae]|uniref:Mrr restriction endonuclease-like protein n=1 Tax=Kordia periserrulae TaxID=701523 RepID=A0A2T6C0R7_9FLAO|nr:hypothetical protein [Kordia periserrulae]PTX61911.1 Mrr restriction endonuclease-like protein [Kordia periserrulae]
MKKTIGKPENWQDFESLCKKLWGEIWEIPNKIKKNGRLGQNQAGVDVYGIPKGENRYWGIQAKGKDDYSSAKLTKSEIIEEIIKAKKFEPNLAVYIIATTSNKDAKIEKFVRLKDIENQKNGSFEILLFCWEDIVDLIEDNQDTYNWYLNGIGQRGRFDFDISFNDLKKSLTLNPVYEKTITKFKMTTKTDSQLLIESLNSNENLLNFSQILLDPFNFNQVNKSWVDFELIMENKGAVVLEDWRLMIFFKEGVSHLDDGHPILPKLSTTIFIDDEDKTITYHPKDNTPLIQKDNRFFEISLLPEINSTKIVFEWELLARDFNKKGMAEIEIEPNYIEKIEYNEVNKELDLEDDKIDISYYVVKG